MRLTGLLSLLLFVLIVFFAATAASYAQTANSSTNKIESTDSAKPQFDQEHRAIPPSDRPMYLAQPLVEHGGDLVLRETPENEGLCYAMRTYIVAREDKTSDITHPVRQVKCTPARKFGVKTADVRVEETPKPETK